MFTETEKPPGLPIISRSRLECLFDGIFAIAMTILVLDLKIPDLNHPNSVAELGQALRHFAPVYGSYVLSFAVLGMFWYRHNQQFHHFQIITGKMLFFQMIQLALAASFPYCASLLGRYPGNPLCNVLYVGCAFIYFGAMLGNWLVAKRCGALKAEVSETDYLRIRKRLLRNGVFITCMFSYVLIRLWVQF